jgi:hypothetical protein
MSIISIGVIRVDAPIWLSTDDTKSDGLRLVLMASRTDGEEKYCILPVAATR